jgi:hypothetical protein
MPRKPQKQKIKRGRKTMGLEPKVSKLFTLDEGVFGIFKIMCKQNKRKMSSVVQELMHTYNISNANK